MNHIFTKVLGAMAETLRSGSWIREAMLEAGVSLSQEEMTNLTEASKDVVTAIEALVELKDPSTPNLIDSLEAAVNVFGALVGQLPSSLNDRLSLDSALNVLLLITAYILEEVQPRLSGLLRVLGLIETRHVPANGRSHPVLFRQASARTLIKVFEDPVGYMVERLTDKPNPLARSGLLESIAHFGNAAIISGSSNTAWLDAIRASRSALATAGGDISHAALISLKLGRVAVVGAGVYVVEDEAGEKIRFGIAPIIDGLDRKTMKLTDAWVLEVMGDLSLPGIVLEFEADKTAGSLESYVESSGPLTGGPMILVKLRGYETMPLVLLLIPVKN